MKFAAVLGGVALALASSMPAVAQHLTLEGQTGGFLTPTAYVVYVAKGQTFSHPAIGYHFINTDKVIGNVHTFNIVEGIANRAEIGYTRTAHEKGSSSTFSELWNAPGMNILSGKVVAVKDGQFGEWTPGIAVGGIVRLHDEYVSGKIYEEVMAAYGVPGKRQAFNNGDGYIAVTKTRLKPPVPVMLNLGWKVTNTTLFGLGGQGTGWQGRFFGGLGLPIPGPKGTAIVPSAGFTQQSAGVKNLGSILVNVGATGISQPGKAHVPTTLDYAVRITQKTDPHFSFDIGVGQVANNIGTTATTIGGKTYLIPVELQARKVVGMGISYRY